MTKAEWLAKVEEKQELLKSLIANYHPRLPHKPRHELEITAPNAEMARQTVVKEMLLSGECQGDPVKRFEVALATEDIGELMSILNRTWFGVPESTSCWNISGFSEAVDLMDDPPEQEDENAET